MESRLTEEKKIEYRSETIHYGKETIKKITSVKALHNGGFFLMDNTHSQYVATKDDDAFHDAKTSEEIEKKITYLPNNKKKHLKLEQDWCLILKDRCIHIINEKSPGRSQRKKIPGKVSYLNLLNKNTIIVISVDKYRDYYRSYILKWEQGKIREKIKFEHTFPEKFYPINSDCFIQVRRNDQDIFFYFYDTQSLNIQNALKVDYKRISHLKILPDEETILFFPIETLDNHANKLHLLNTRTCRIDMIDLGKPMIDFDILPNGTIIIAFKDGEVIQFKLKSIQDLRKKNTHKISQIITGDSEIKQHEAKIIADYVGFDITSSKNNLFFKHNLQKPPIPQNQLQNLTGLSAKVP